MNGSGDFEQELERQLHRILDPIAALPIPPRRPPVSRVIAWRLVEGAGAALGLKLVTGVAIAAFAAAAAGMATEVAVTGSLNPSTWGQSVTQAVQTCKDNLRASGTRGIGPCVSAIASQHGQQVSDSSKSNGDAKDKGKSDVKTRDKGNGDSNGNGNGKSDQRGGGSGNGNGNGNGHKDSGSGRGGGNDH